MEFHQLMKDPIDNEALPVNDLDDIPKAVRLCQGSHCPWINEFENISKDVIFSKDLIDNGMLLIYFLLDKSILSIV